MKHEVQLTPSARLDRDHILAWHDTEAPQQTERFIDEDSKVVEIIAVLHRRQKPAHPD